MNHLVLALGSVGLSFVVGCGGQTDAEPVHVDREVELVLAQGSGVDDFGSPGAALGYSVDTAQRLMLVVALKFSLPLYSTNFAPPSAPTQSLREYEVKAPNAVLVDDVARYPLLATAITDTNGIRSLSGSKAVAAFLLEGDFQSPTPERVWVAFSGALTLTREDGPDDFLDGYFDLREVSGLGDSARVLRDGETLGLKTFSFDWDTSDQP